MKKISIFLSLLIVTVFLSGCSQQTATPTNKVPTQAPTVVLTTLPTNVSTIIINNFAFSPANLTVKVGTTVTWQNEDTVLHLIKSDLFNSPSLKTGDTFKFTFDNKGSYDYVCSLHPSMLGQIIVTE